MNANTEFVENDFEAFVAQEAKAQKTRKRFVADAVTYAKACPTVYLTGDAILDADILSGAVRIAKKGNGRISKGEYKGVEAILRDTPSTNVAKLVVDLQD